MKAFGFLQVISTALGYVLPNLISRKATQHAASVLYTFFGLRLLYIAWYSKPQESNQVGCCMLNPGHMQSCSCTVRVMHDRYYQGVQMKAAPDIQTYNAMDVACVLRTAAWG